MDGWEILDQARDLTRRGEPFVLATVVWRRGPSSGKQGYRAVITASGAVRGWIGGACAEPAVVREARHVLTEGTPRLMFLGPAEELKTVARPGVTSVPISCQSQGALEIYLEPVQPRTHLVAVGRSPMVHALVQMANAIGWRTTLVDPDPGLPDDHPPAERVVGGLDFAAAEVGRHTLVVVATQGHHDEEALEQVIAAEPAYIGLVASTQRGRGVLGYLRDRGLPEEALERVRVPAGLDLGRTSHREIAVAVLAELVQLRTSGALLGQAHAQVVEPEEAVDPVCGMTVEIASARHTLEHEQTTYYFCCPGCRQTFKKDPVAYASTAAR